MSECGPECISVHQVCAGHHGDLKTNHVSFLLFITNYHRISDLTWDKFFCMLIGIQYSSNIAIVEMIEIPSLLLMSY